MRALCLAFVAVLACARVFGQSLCEDEMGARTCTYDFSVPADGYIPDWEERTPSGLNHLGVADGVGSINVIANGGIHYLDNNAHLTWDYVGGGFNEASAVLSFAGDSGKTGWIEKFSDGVSLYGLCQPKTHASRASDEMMLLTLYDDGESFVGGFIGGDGHPLGVTLPYDPQPPPSNEWRGFAVMGVVQKLAGETLPRVLAVTYGRPIPMGAQGLHLRVRVDDGRILAIAEKEGWSRTYVAEAKLAGAPNLAGGVGLNGIVLPKPYWCIYRPGGEINRQFELSKVIAKAAAR